MRMPGHQPGCFFPNKMLWESIPLYTIGLSQSLSFLRSGFPGLRASVLLGSQVTSALIICETCGAFFVIGCTDWKLRYLSGCEDFSPLGERLTNVSKEEMERLDSYLNHKIHCSFYIAQMLQEAPNVLLEHNAEAIVGVPYRKLRLWLERVQGPFLDSFHRQICGGDRDRCLHCRPKRRSADTTVVRKIRIAQAKAKECVPGAIRPFPDVFDRFRQPGKSVCL